MNISKIQYCQNVALVTLRNVPSDGGATGVIFGAISGGGINVDMISQTAPQGGAIAVAFTVSTDALTALMPIINALKPQFPGLNLEVSAGMTKLNFYDADMVHTPGVAAHVFSTLAKEQVEVMMITTSTMDISLLIQEHNEATTLRLCRDTYRVDPQESPFA